MIKQLLILKIRAQSILFLDCLKNVSLFFRSKLFTIFVYTHCSCLVSFSSLILVRSLYIPLYREQSCLLLDFVLLGWKVQIVSLHTGKTKSLLGSAWKRESECDPIADYSFLKGGSGANGADLLSLGNSDRTQGRGMKLNQRKFRHTNIRLYLWNY